MTGKICFWVVMGIAVWLPSAVSAAEPAALDPLMQTVVGQVEQDLRYTHNVLGRDFVSRFLHDRRRPWSALIGEELRWREFLREARQFTDDGSPSGPLLAALAEQRRLIDRMRYLRCPLPIRAVNRQIRHLPVWMNGSESLLRFGELIGTIPAAGDEPARQIAIAALIPEFSRRVVYKDQVYFFGVMQALAETGETVAVEQGEMVLCIWLNGRNIYNMPLGSNAQIVEYRVDPERLTIVSLERDTAGGGRRVLRRIPYQLLMRLPQTDVPFAAAALCQPRGAQ